MFAAAALMFAACSSNDKLEDATVQQQNLPDGAVGFDAYIQRGVTRAGWVGTVTGGNTGLGERTDDETKLGSHGFGVFGYYTDNNEYDPQSLPNFFYNQKVYAKTTVNVFEYEPVKYWPNEYGTNAISDDADKVTFFAYAPYVEVVPSTGKIKGTAEDAKWGITGMSRNISGGDPLIKYIVSFDEDKMVDLCWGVCDNPNWATINDGNKYLNEGVMGKPWINVERPLGYTDQRVKFTFKHALSQLNVTADTYADGTTAQSIDPKSRVYIRSITFTGFATKGTLNLNNETPNKAQWLDYNGTSELESGEEVTIYDGRKDGKEGTAGGVATNEKMLGLNPMFIQDEEQIDYTVNPVAFKDPATAHTGVDGTTRNMFRKWNSTEYVAMEPGDPILVIPTGEKVKVTIVYDVETPSPNLGVYLSDGKTPGSTIENRIEKDIDFGGAGMENGKKYTIHLHLGMNSVKFDASVDNWQDDLNTDIDLPSNAPEFAAASSPYGVYDFAVPATDAATTYNIKLTGFNGGESITPARDGIITADPTGAQADASGVVTASFEVPAYNKVTIDNTGYAVWTSATTGSNKQVKLHIIQQPHELGLGIKTINAGSNAIEITSTAGDIDWAADVNPSTGIKVTRNGVALTYSAGSPSAGQFGWDADNQAIILADTETAKSKEVFVITVKAGDAPAETKSKVVEGTAFGYSPASRTVVYRESSTYSVVPAGVTGSMSYSSSNTVVATVDTDGKLTTKEEGATTITATQTGPDETDNLALMVVKQDAQINNFENDSQSGDAAVDMGVIKNWSSVTATGTLDTGTSAGDVTLSVTGATKDGEGITADDWFEIGTGSDANKLKTKQELPLPASGTETVYKVTVQAVSAGVDKKFKTQTKEAVYTITIRNPAP